MLEGTQARILRLLARYPEDLEEAWDVPRDLSLPGLSENLGLVRSALHEPLKSLEKSGLIYTRSAHVIDGGSRRRNVVHITAKGRQQADLIIAEFGDVQIKVNDGGKLQGRTTELTALKTALKDDGFAIVTGMPGIGKTALLLELENSRMCTLNSSMDSTQLVGIWLDSKDPPRDIEAQIEMLSTIENTILIADEIQSVHERHRGGIDALLERLMQADGPPLALSLIHI